MKMKCTGCGNIEECKEIHFCRRITNPNGIDPCGSLVLPYDEEEKTEEISSERMVDNGSLYRA